MGHFTGPARTPTHRISCILVLNKTRIDWPTDLGSTRIDTFTSKIKSNQDTN